MHGMQMYGKYGESPVLTRQIICYGVFSASFSSMYVQPHRDTEKTDEMFGTLIVQLPSEYEGGQLRVKHAKKEHVFDFSGLKGSTGFHCMPTANMNCAP